MLIIQSNCNPNQEMMVSRINEMTETITWLPVRLGESMLRLGREVRLGRAKIAQEGVSRSPRQTDFRLCETAFAQEKGVGFGQNWGFFALFHRKFP